jgi:sporulation integral membrane protein YtvI
LELNARTKEVLYKGIKIVLILVFLYLLFSWLIFFVMPFIIGFIVALLARPVVNWLVTRFKLPRSVSAITVLLIAVIIIGGVIIIAVSQTVGLLTGLVSNAYDIYTLPTQFFRDIVDRARQFYINLPEETVALIEQNLKTVFLNLAEYFIGASTKLLSNLRALPRMFIFIVVTFMASYFIIRDFDTIMGFISDQLPPSWHTKVRDAKSDMIKAVVGYIKAQTILVITSFIITLAGLLIMEIRYGLIIAIIIMIFDILPVVGSGTILIPWSIVNLILGNYSQGIALMVLYAVITVVRQVMEPRVVGKNIGLHPLTALFSMYVGLKVFGITGLFIGPIIAVIIKIMQRSGILPQWKKRI